MLPPRSAIRASALSGLLSVPFLSSALAADTPLQHRAPHVITDSPSATAQAAGATVSVVSFCHIHDGVQFCQAGASEFRISGTVTASSYTGCHAHNGGETFCRGPTSTDEVEIILVTPTPTQGAAAAASSITAVTGCHMHDPDLVCKAGTTEYKIQTSVTATQDLPPQFTGCHSHGDGNAELHCEGPDGKEVTATILTEDHDEEEHTESESGGQNCHFHAGVEHCTGSSGEKVQTCERVHRDYNIKLRVGLLFVMLVTSSIGVFTPILISSFVSPNHIVFTILRQFGTGVIISTAFVHLYTHAVLMFQNECLGDLGYEATASAILMAGLFLSFLIEYAGIRFMQWHQAKEAARSPESIPVDGAAPKTDMVNITVLEAGVIFHSLLIGLTLVVAGDAFFGTLFAVIVFHQMFEGLALGTRIAALGREDSASLGHGHSHSHHGHSHHAPAHPHYHPEPKSSDQVATTPTDGALPAAHQHKNREEVSSSDESDGTPTPGETVAHVSMRKKLLLALAFALVTPIGMAIGIGALHQFNGNDPSTVIAIGTLDAFSAGILVWVGVVEMWAHDWMLGGEMTHSGPLKTFLGLAAMMLGLGVMSLLGKWA
ncbi:putative zinc-regulated transporter [Podospora australis]|uniref:Zinc-regulated transporter n=1 Tax=Podospora australis TaxID=1536484 RepID=A0AAN6WP44_9PEZI|nr:putative zinc-regulated transporter [Podospora australis]